MKFENVKSEGMKHEYKIVFQANEIEDSINEAVKERAKTFKMQGFRAGHVPLNIVRNSVENSVINDVLESLISKACDKIIKDTKTQDLASRPIYKFENKYEKDKDLNVTLTFEAAPAFELKSYDLSIEKITPKVSQEEIEEEKKKFMDSFPVYEIASKDHSITNKDEVAYKAVCYNKGIESKKKSFENAIIIPDSIQKGAEFLEKFIGKKVKEDFDFTPATDKNLNYKFIIKSIKKPILDINEEDFAKKKGFKDLESLNTAIKEKLENDINSQAFLYHKSQILEELEKNYSFELPDGIIEQEMKSVLATVKRDIEQQKKKGEKVEEKTDEELKEEYADVVKQRVLLGYILNKIAKQEKISASDDEVRNLIMSEVNSNPSMSNAIIDYYSKNQGAVAYKRAEIIEHKVVSFLISKAKTTEIEKTKKEVDEIIEKLFED